MKKIAFLATFLMLFCGFGINNVFSADKVINMRPGQEEFYKVESIKRISVANPYVADAKVLSGGKQIMIRAANPGETTITIFDEKENKTVYLVKVSSLLNEKAEKIKEQLEGVETVRVKLVGDKIVIDGVVLREKDAKPLAKIKELYGNDVKFLVENKIGKTAGYIVSAIQSDMPDDVVVKQLGDGVMLEGTVSSEEEKNNAERIAREYVENVYSIIKVVKKGIKITVSGIEFDINSLKNAMSDKNVKLLYQCAKRERGLFGIVLDDSVAVDNFSQSLLNECAGEMVFDSSETENDGQLKIDSENGSISVYYKVSPKKDGVYELLISLLDEKKHIITKRRFYVKNMEALSVCGIYKVLNRKGLIDKKGKELILFFTFGE